MGFPCSRDSLQPYFVPFHTSYWERLAVEPLVKYMYFKGNKFEEGCVCVCVCVKGTCVRCACVKGAFVYVCVCEVKGAFVYVCVCEGCICVCVRV